MAMNDEETVALIVGGHTVGKAHGAVSPDYLGPEPEGCPVEAQGIGWHNTYETGHGVHTLTSGLEGAWTNNPTQWDNGYLENLYKYDWDLTESPAGAKQWTPTDPAAKDTVPDAHDPSKRHAPVMFTTDLALRMDPTYAEITKRFLENPDQLNEAFAKAWYKLLHRDMGPVSRYLGPWVAEPQLWQDPVPAVDHELVGDADVAALKDKLLGSGLSIAQLVRTAWAAAASFRGTDKRGGANGARLRLEPQRNWAVNDPDELAQVLPVLEQIQQDFNGAQSGGTKVSLADLIVLGGCAAVERAAKNAGVDVTVPFAPGRTDATQEQTDVESAAVLEPTFDGFRNYLQPGEKLSPETLLVERAYMLNLTAPEMTVLVAGMRALNANYRQTPLGVFTDRPETLTNDFFVNLLDMNTEWKPSLDTENVYDGRDRSTGEVKWTATAVDLVFGHHSQLRALAEFYGAGDAQEKFVRDFVAAWNKVMNLDRFDLA
jgi:catalase-peroxidase